MRAKTIASFWTILPSAPEVGAKENTETGLLQKKATGLMGWFFRVLFQWTNQL